MTTGALSRQLKRRAVALFDAVNWSMKYPG